LALLLQHKRKKLRSVPDDSAVLLVTPGENGTSSKVMIGRLKQSQNLTKRAALTLASMSSTPARKAVDLPHTDWPAVESGKADDNVSTEVLLNLQELPVVHDQSMILRMSYGCVSPRVQRVKPIFRAIKWVSTDDSRRVLPIIRRKI
jgi:hypothetical protein